MAIPGNGCIFLEEGSLVVLNTLFKAPHQKFIMGDGATIQITSLFPQTYQVRKFQQGNKISLGGKLSNDGVSYDSQTGRLTLKTSIFTYYFIIGRGYNPSLFLILPDGQSLTYQDVAPIDPYQEEEFTAEVIVSTDSQSQWYTSTYTFSDEELTTTEYLETTDEELNSLEISTYVDSEFLSLESLTSNSIEDEIKESSGLTEGDYSSTMDNMSESIPKVNTPSELVSMTDEGDLQSSDEIISAQPTDSELPLTSEILDFLSSSDFESFIIIESIESYGSDRLISGDSNDTTGGSEPSTDDVEMFESLSDNSDSSEESEEPIQDSTSVQVSHEESTNTEDYIEQSTESNSNSITFDQIVLDTTGFSESSFSLLDESTATESPSVEDSFVYTNTKESQGSHSFEITEESINSEYIHIIDSQSLESLDTTSMEEIIIEDTNLIGSTSQSDDPFAETSISEVVIYSSDRSYEEIQLSSDETIVIELTESESEENIHDSISYESIALETSIDTSNHEYFETTKQSSETIDHSPETTNSETFTLVENTKLFESTDMVSSDEFTTQNESISQLFSSETHEITATSDDVSEDVLTEQTITPALPSTSSNQEYQTENMETPQEGMSYLSTINIDYQESQSTEKEILPGESITRTEHIFFSIDSTEDTEFGLSSGQVVPIELTLSVETKGILEYTTGKYSTEETEQEYYKSEEILSIDEISTEDFKSTDDSEGLDLETSSNVVPAESINIETESLGKSIVISSEISLELIESEILTFESTSDIYKEVTSISDSLDIRISSDFNFETIPHNEPTSMSTEEDYQPISSDIISEPYAFTSLSDATILITEELPHSSSIGTGEYISHYSEEIESLAISEEVNTNETIDREHLSLPSSDEGWVDSTQESYPDNYTTESESSNIDPKIQSISSKDEYQVVTSVVDAASTELDPEQSEDKFQLDSTAEGGIEFISEESFDKEFTDDSTIPIVTPLSESIVLLESSIVTVATVESIIPESFPSELESIEYIPKSTISEEPFPELSSSDTGGSDKYLTKETQSRQATESTAEIFKSETEKPVPIHISSNDSGEEGILTNEVISEESTYDVIVDASKWLTMDENTTSMEQWYEPGTEETYPSQSITDGDIGPSTEQLFPWESISEQESLSTKQVLPAESSVIEQIEFLETSSGEMTGEIPSADVTISLSPTEEEIQVRSTIDMNVGSVTPLTSETLRGGPSTAINEQGFEFSSKVIHPPESSYIGEGVHSETEDIVFLESSVDVQVEPITTDELISREYSGSEESSSFRTEEIDSGPNSTDREMVIEPTRVSVVSDESTNDGESLGSRTEEIDTSVSTDRGADTIHSQSKEVISEWSTDVQDSVVNTGTYDHLSSAEPFGSSDLLESQSVLTITPNSQGEILESIGPYTNPEKPTSTEIHPNEYSSDEGGYKFESTDVVAGQSTEQGEQLLQSSTYMTLLPEYTDEPGGLHSNVKSTHATASEIEPVSGTEFLVGESTNYSGQTWFTPVELTISNTEKPGSRDISTQEPVPGNIPSTSDTRFNKESLVSPASDKLLSQESFLTSDYGLVSDSTDIVGTASISSRDITNSGKGSTDYKVSFTNTDVPATDSTGSVNLHSATTVIKQGESTHSENLYSDSSKTIVKPTNDLSTSCKSCGENTASLSTIFHSDSVELIIPTKSQSDQSEIFSTFYSKYTTEYTNEMGQKTTAEVVISSNSKGNWFKTTRELVSTKVYSTSTNTRGEVSINEVIVSTDSKGNKHTHTTNIPVSIISRYDNDSIKDSEGVKTIPPDGRPMLSLQSKSTTAFTGEDENIDIIDTVETIDRKSRDQSTSSQNSAGYVLIDYADSSRIQKVKTSIYLLCGLACFVLVF
ncbi:uncharacterized protein SPAPADRAFT_65736 [Spathaspora passalidarum NRRL Y-27907]|uniref:Hyphally-regulated cell wall protein N-terminal domain-containing protein n=1 Tax=Spathaspora passalidarum (strain NRRL Y-27907 / 11-Y1) TaxID=619300 RepID=G3AJL0_SPAPN|nr:uncharacterized protein SPAPADRAFT_65736 [Spathaspora passalidarum NRRL Y-27907]EGW34615.1 hypothetical protein SPAPADRAFT_65736 [Spathaspora passalidarum NRRL Y-27907]